MPSFTPAPKLWQTRGLRSVSYTYRDPLDEIWLATATRVGLRVERREDAYASSDGNRALVIAPTASLDPDDSLAQLIFHELCHSMIEGPESFEKRDWGLENVDGRDREREHACLRLQAFLANQYGLRTLFAPTTEHRPFYDALPPDTLRDRNASGTTLAIRGAQRVGRPPWAPHIDDALRATRTIADGATDFAIESSLWSTPSPTPPMHPLGGQQSPRGTCGECVWQQGPSCLQLHQDCSPDWQACHRFEPALDCQNCAACCRAAYHSVEVTCDDPMTSRHPDLIQDRGHYLELQRTGDRCAALEGPSTGPFACRIYNDRPTTCREFAQGSEHCLTARRRVGLSF